MSIKTLFYADGTTVYNASDFRALISPLMTNGVQYVGVPTAMHPDLGGDFCVLPNSGMSVSVLPGVAAKKYFKSQTDISGETYSIISDIAVTVDVPANTSGYNRIDLIVIEIDPVNNVTIIKDVQGTPSSDPQKPSPNGYQLPLAYVAVGNNVSVINQNVITDARVQMSVPIALQTNTGTFTPFLKGSIAEGSFTYYDQRGQYTVIGDVCIAQVKVEINATITSAAGNLMLGGLPRTGSGQAHYTNVEGRINGAPFHGIIDTADGTLFNANGIGHVESSTIVTMDGFACTLVYKC